jgi:1-acyl-sn-glycerol-3-phosphate acyltransferase
MALKHGWIISFPQGTTSPYAPIRKGTGYLIKENDPIVVPVVINGFRRAFDKKGLRLKKRNTILSVKFGAPIRFDKDCSVDDIVNRVRKEIGQEIPYDKLTWMKDADPTNGKKFGY